MIKIGNNEYAGFGLGHAVDLDFIRSGILYEHCKVFYPTPTEKKDLLKKIAISQIAIFKRN
jgi:hypothetical protein